MKELIKITQHNGNSFISARELHKFLEVGKVFGAWINERIEQFGFIENQDYVVFSEIGKNLKGGRPMKEYLLSIDMAKELSMLERNEKGKQARIYFIECEKRLREQSLNYYSIEVSPERIAERRKILQKQFVEELRKYFYRGDLTNDSKENKISYNKIIRVMSGNSFDDRIIDILYEKAMNNKYSLECKMEVMITDLKS